MILDKNRYEDKRYFSVQCKYRIKDEVVRVSIDLSDDVLRDRRIKIVKSDLVLVEDEEGET